MRAVLVVVTLAAVVGCHDSPNRFAVRGTVNGLVGGTTTLLIDGQPAAMLGNGDFVVRDAVFGGSMYTLAVSSDDELQGCAFGPEVMATGVVHSDLVVSVACSSLDTGLASLSASIAPLLQSDLTLNEFSTSPVAVRPVFFETVATTISARPTNPLAEMTVDGNPLIPDVPSVSIGLSLSENPIGLSLSLPNGVVRNVTIKVPGVEVLRVAPTSPALDQRFGAAVALAYDGSTLAVGAPGVGGPGAVIVFGSVGGLWNQEARIQSEPSCNGCKFGAAVALSMDGSRLVVGAPNEANGAGAAYVFERSGSNWIQDSRLDVMTPQDGASLGTSVAIAADGSIAVVGAPGGPALAGSVAVFVRGVTWSAKQMLTPTASQMGDGFGASVAISGTTIAAGAPGTMNGTGAVIAFVTNGTSYSQQVSLVASSTPVGSHFGAAIALAGDELVVGSPDEVSGSGRTYTYARTNSTWAGDGFLDPQVHIVDSHFGASVALEAVSPVRAVAGEVGNGVLHAFERGWFESTTRTSQSAASEFGASVAIAGACVVVGAPGDANNAGAIYSF